MSAFMCTDRHINALVQFGAENDASYRTTGTRIYFKNDEQRIALILQAANARSVNYRYAHNIGAQCHDDPIVYKRGAKLDPLIIIKAAHCFDYQSCEPDDWEGSTAQTITRAIVDAATRELPGYDAAPWGIAD